MLKKTMIMNFVEENGGTVTRGDLNRFIIELRGEAYNTNWHRGINSYALRPGTIYTRPGFLVTPSKKEPRYLTKIGRGLYKLVNPLS